MLSEDIVGSSDCEEVTDEVCGAEVDCDEVEEVGKRAFCGEGVEGDGEVDRAVRGEHRHGADGLQVDVVDGEVGGDGAEVGGWG